MKINRKLALKILKYQFNHPKFKFPFLIMCKELSSEDDDFVEVWTENYKDLKKDKFYKTFELWENFSNYEEKSFKKIIKNFFN